MSYYLDTENFAIKYEQVKIYQILIQILGINGYQEQFYAAKSYNRFHKNMLFYIAFLQLMSSWYV